MLLVYVLSHLCATYANRAVGCAISIPTAAAAADAEERVLCRSQLVNRAAVGRWLSYFSWRKERKIFV
jgi:hypothetical protein